MVNMLAWLTGRNQGEAPSPVRYDDGQPSLRAYNPAPSEQFNQWLSGLLGAGPGASLAKQNFATGIPSLLAASPLGIGLSAADLIHAKNANDPMGAAAAAIGMVPGLKPEVQAVRQGIRAYHGSPHDFDRFDISKIGTGEGAQAYGHGLYFAENEGVARSYRDQLAPNYTLAQQYLQQHENPQQALAAFDAMHGKDKYPEVRKQIERGGERGSMYEVNINARPEQFLDWDKPISKSTLDTLNLSPSDVRTMQYVAPKDNKQLGATGRDLYWYMNSDKAKASAELAEAGIPGIRYLDQGSRQAGEGSHNYVLFNDQLVDIMRKYGLAAPAAAGAASYAMAPQEAQAGKAQPAQFQPPQPLSDKINQMIDSLQWGDQWQGRMRLPLQNKVNNMLGESVWPPLR